MTSAENLPDSPSFVARETELTRLQGYLAQAVDGNGRVIFVTGEAGAGKTTLVTEFARQAQQNNGELLFVVGNCNAQTGRGDPYLPFREVLGLLTGDVDEKLAQGAITAEGAQRLQKFVKISGEALVEIGPLLISTLLPGVGSFIGRISVFAADKLGWLDKLKNLANKPEIEHTELSQEQIFAQYTAILKTLSTRQPLLLWLDDLHWVDPDSAALLFQLGRALEHNSVLIIGTYRQEDVALLHGGEPHPMANIVNEFKRYWGDIQIDLDQARAGSGRDFVDALLDTFPNQLGEDFRQALFNHTGGHPLFTVELLHDLQERGDLQPDRNGHWFAVPALDWRLLPARVEGVIEKRINRLDTELQEALTIASVEGEQFTIEVVARMLQIPARDLVRRFSREASKQHRLVQAQSSQHVGRQRLSRYQFRHSLIQKYLYHNLDEVERAYLHEDMASILEEIYTESAELIEDQLETLVYHFYAAELWPKVLEYARRAGEKGLAWSAPQTAVDQFTVALTAAEMLDDPSISSLYRKRGLAFDTLGDFDRARNDYETAQDKARAANDHYLLWQTMLDLGLLWASRDYEKTGEYCQAALALAREIADQATIGHSLNRLGNWVMNKGEPAKALTYHQEALGIFKELDDPRGTAATLDLLAMTNGQYGDFPITAAYYEQAIPILRELNEQKTLASSLTNLASFTLDITQIQEAISIAREIRWRSGEAYALNNLGFILAAKGDYGGGLTAANQGLALAREIGHRLWQCACHVPLGEIYHDLLAEQQARDHLEEGLRLAQEVGSHFFINFNRGLLASICVQTGQLDEADALLVELPDRPTMMTDFVWAKPVAELALARGEADRALLILDGIQLPDPAVWNGRMTTFFGPLLLLRGKILLSLNQLAEAEHYLQKAIQLYEQSGIKLGLWPMYLVLSQLYLQMNDLVRANDAVQAARDVISAISATLDDDTLRTAFRQRAEARIP
ncbi:MAG: hypothetical protein CL608_32175 [Anaerolineaceae bacterium]|nr:hypothetical protein [Anaerolineaceae bacterium]